MLSSTAKYALRTVAVLARQPRLFVSRSEISAATQVPHDYLLKVIHQLVDAGFVESRRGRDGGYRLTRSPEELSTLDIVLVVDEVPRITKCPLGIPDHEQLCPLHQLLDETSRLVEETLRRTNLADLTRSQPRQCSFPENT